MKNKGMFEVNEKIYQEEKKRHKFNGHILHNIYKDVKIPWGGYVFTWFIALVSFGLTGLKTGQTAKIVSGDITDYSVILSYAIISVVASALAVFGVVADYANVKVTTQVRNRLWRKIMHLPTRYFDEQTPNRIISRVTNDTESAAVPFSVITIFFAVLGLGLGVLVSGASLNSTMLGVLVGGFVLTLIVVCISTFVIALAGFQGMNRLSIFTSYLSERLGNIKLIKASKSEHEELEKGYEIIETRYKAGLFAAFAQFLMAVGMEISMVAIYVAAFLVGAFLLSNGTFADGKAINEFYVYGTGLGVVLLLMGQLPTLLATAAGGATEFAAVFDNEEEDTRAGGEMPKTLGDIRLEKVGFSYDGSREILKKVSCVIPKGRKTAVIGSNGSGKTTMIKLIDRLYPDIDGNIYMGEENAADISLAAWRDKFGIVSQNASLFGGTIKENICYGIDREVSLEELDAIARLSHIDEIVAGHEGGYDFDIGVNGSRLSGGEQQRLAIARAMMKNPDYLILDEATANLDARTENELKEGISALMKGRTVIMIAHKFETIREADYIIVVDNGEIVADGTHEQLMETCEFYQMLAGGLAQGA